MEFSPRNRPKATSTPFLGPSYRPWLLLILLAAFSLRTWDLHRLPPGLFFDEAYYGIDARGVIEGLARPFFFAGNNGREPLFIYLQSLTVALLGASSYSLRLTAAFAGVLSVAVIWALIRRLLHWAQGAERADATWAALIGAAALSVSYWHVSLSRLGFRVILLPLLSALAVYFLAKAWREGRQVNFALAGFWLGATQYTYISARLLPVVVVGYIVIELLFHLTSRRKEAAKVSVPLDHRLLPGVGLLLAVALTTAAPLLWTFWRQPDLLNARTGDVSIFTPESVTAPGTPAERLLNNALRVAGAFFVTGDLNPRHNLPGRPVNDLLLAGLFIVGFVRTLGHWRQPVHRLVLFWFLVMLTPTLLSLEAPHWLRMVGALPPLVFFYASGAQAIAAALGRRMQAARLFAALLAAVLVVSGALTTRDYFVRWAQWPTLAGVFDADRYEAAAAVRVLLADENVSAILLTRRLYRSAQMRLLNPDLPGAAPRLADEDEWRAIAAGAHYLIEYGADPTQPLFLLERQANGALTAMQLSPFDANGRSIIAAVVEGQSFFLQQSVEGPPYLPHAHLYTGETPALILKPERIQYPLTARFTNGIELVGYALPVGAAPCEMAGKELPLTLYLRHSDVDRGEDMEALLFAHLMLPELQLQDNGPLGNGYPLTLWRNDDVIDDRRTFLLPDHLTPGKGYFEAGLFWLSSSGVVRRAGIVDAEGRIGGDQVIFGPIELCNGVAKAAFDDLSPVGAVFEGRIALDGVRSERPADEPGMLRVELGWRALDRSPTAYTAFVHLLDEEGTIVSQHDFPPGGETNPTHLWVPGETVRSTALLSLPSDFDPARYRLRIGLYEPVSGRQLAVKTPEQGEEATFLIIEGIE
ncbi:MAG: glycosyltransferase family 39 protein [Caldilinea sp.]|nr:glycosyltransferase family 39 protein [Caldilinea sp.]MDW8439336.1 glycosyltransferase family 39 protein [Caldilineaceae bacterium]